MKRKLKIYENDILGGEWGKLKKAIYRRRGLKRQRMNKKGEMMKMEKSFFRCRGGYHEEVNYW